MSYSDDWRDMQHAYWLREWTPEGIGTMAVSEEQTRFLLAKTREQEATIKTFNDAKRALKALVA